MVAKQLELHKPDVNYSPGQNTWNKGEKSRFLTAITKV